MEKRKMEQRKVIVDKTLNLLFTTLDKMIYDKKRIELIEDIHLDKVRRKLTAYDKTIALKNTYNDIKDFYRSYIKFFNFKNWDWKLSIIEDDNKEYFVLVRKKEFEFLFVEDFKDFEYDEDEKSLKVLKNNDREKVFYSIVEHSIIKNKLYILTTPQIILKKKGILSIEDFYKLKTLQKDYIKIELENDLLKESLEKNDLRVIIKLVSSGNPTLKYLVIEEIKDEDEELKKFNISYFKKDEEINKENIDGIFIKYKDKKKDKEEYVAISY